MLLFIRPALRSGNVRFLETTDLEVSVIYRIETEEEIPGAMCYGNTRNDAIALAEAVALRAIADRIEHGEQAVAPIQITFDAA